MKPSALARKLAQGDAGALALCVGVAVLLLRLAASGTMDAAPTAFFGLFIGGLALGSAMRRGGAAIGSAVALGALVGALSGAVDGAIAGAAACVGAPDLRSFNARPVSCDSAIGVLLFGAGLWGVVGAISVWIGASGTPKPEQ